LVFVIRGALLFHPRIHYYWSSAMFFFPFLGISALALGLVQLGALAVTVQILKAMLAVALVVASLLSLALIVRRNNDSKQ
jgi:hypothetical protein